MKKSKDYYDLILEEDFNGDWKEYIRSRIDQEGFDYAFLFFSHFPEVKNKKFHKLRKEYIAARNALAKCIGYGE